MLASGSPQRRALLASLNVEFTVRVTDVQELEGGLEPARLALENARLKVRAAAREGEPGAAEVLIGCDTIVVLDGVVYGKPPDAAHARRTLEALGGRTHEVLSGLVLLWPAEGARAETERTAVARSEVGFRAFEPEELERHIALGEWRGRSGGYAIQGGAAALVVGLEGERENVVGLPLRTLLELYPQLVQNHWQGVNPPK